MSEAFALGGFLERWSPRVRYDLSGSEAATLTLSALLGLAGAEDRRRWQELGLGYTDPRGAAWLRSAIAARYDNLDDAHVVCCAGAQEALTSVMRALLAPGDHAVVVVPIYQPSEWAIASICAATGVPLEDRDTWCLDVDRVASALRGNTKLVLMNFPNSPTGASIDPTALAALVALCRRHGLWLVNDEVYGLVDLDPCLRSPRVGDVYERGVSINAVSKGFGLPGLRVGWVACRDRRFLGEVQLAKSMLSSCLAAPSEVLAHIALQAEARIVERNRAILGSNRQLLKLFLGRHLEAFEKQASSNAAFAYPRYLGAEGADNFAVELAREAGVLVLPSGLWQSPLAEVTGGRVRIGLGRVGVGAALQALSGYLTRRRRVAAVS
jgi:aspartate/methionine/tyrosine aminotransferase